MKPFYASALSAANEILISHKRTFQPGAAQLDRY